MHRTFRVAVLPLCAVLLVGVAAPAGAATASWRMRFPTPRPSARWYQAQTSDPAMDGIVLFGGFGGHFLSDTWLWSDGRWRLLHPAHHPTARANAGMAYDAPSGDLVLFGGFDGSRRLGDTWTFDGTDWHRQQPAKSPPRGTGPSLFPDPRSGRVDEYGGFDGQFYQLQTWRWRSDQRTWRRVFTKTSPWARSAAVAALDPVRHEVVLFGGIADVNPNNTWTFDGSDWTMQDPAHQPPQTWGAATAFDPVIGKVVSYGGGSPGGQLDDTWEWTGSDWKLLPASNPPVAREGARASYDTDLGRLVMFGGSIGNTFTRQFWTLRA